MFLRCLPPRRIRRGTAPAGYTAGDMGSVLTMRSCDLTMMVLTWAQLGYILIHLDDNGRVVLHKRMDMGNERSAYENRIFKALFGKRRSVDGTGYHYAQLCQKVAAGKPNISGLLRRGSGNPVIFRALMALIGLFAGTSLAGALAGDSFLGILLMIIFAPVGVIVSWVIQEAGTVLHLRFQGKKTTAAICSAVWLALGILSGEWNVALIVIAAQWAAGIAAAYGGRRTDVGRQVMSQALGLRRYLKTVSRADLQRILRSNPDYYYNLAPYALALGVDQWFAKNMGGMRLGSCPYLTTLMDGHMTALEWSRLLRTAVNTLDERQSRIFLEHLLGGR